MIRHLVMSGGGTSLLSMFGALQCTEESGLWKMKDIESIYGTSAGALLAYILALKYDWTELKTYFLRRPWHHVFRWDLYSLLGMIEKRGLWGPEVIEQLLAPLLFGKGLSPNTTLHEFYEATGIEIHSFTARLAPLGTSLVDVSYKTHPQWTVLETIYASCCLPILFSPLVREDELYTDGGLLLNYPVQPCLAVVDEPDTVFGIVNRPSASDTMPAVHASSSFLDYILHLIHHMMSKWIRRNDGSQQSPLRHELYLTPSFLSSFDIVKLSSSEEMRESLMDVGAAVGKTFTMLNRVPPPLKAPDVNTLIPTPTPTPSLPPVPRAPSLQTT